MRGRETDREVSVYKSLSERERWKEREGHIENRGRQRKIMIMKKMCGEIEGEREREREERGDGVREGVKLRCPCYGLCALIGYPV